MGPRIAVAAAFVAGTLVGVGGKALVTPEALGETTRFQNVHVWVARSSADGGVVYGAKQCSYVFSPDAGRRDACADLGELKPAGATAFEAFLSSVELKAPR